MTGSSFADGVFGAASALIAVYSAARLVAARLAGTSSGVSAEITSLLMGLGMAAMFLPTLNVLPPMVWIGVFAVNAAWLIAALPRDAAAGGVFANGERHRLNPVISAVAMVYMFAAMGTPPTAATSMALPVSGGIVLAHDHGGGGDGGFNATPLNVTFAVYFLAHAMWSAGLVVRSGTASGGDRPVTTMSRVLTGSRTTALCHVVMGLGMSYMFASMVG
jgi:hypothetical protein